jgi:DNA (cytosine-5)-methyltransferase 1
MAATKKSFRQPWNVVDLFSGAGGMSLGFHRHPRFRVIGAADAQVGKPSSGAGALQCNSTYRKNIGIEPLEADLGSIEPHKLRNLLGIDAGTEVTVLLCCPPCTGFSRMDAQNHLRDDPRNNLVRRTAEFVAAFNPQILLMENARELLIGNFKHHFAYLQASLVRQGYAISAHTFFLDEFGLPQIRERAIVVAAKVPLVPKNLDDLWSGFKVAQQATTVMRAIGDLPKICSRGNRDALDPAHVAPKFQNKVMIERMANIPKNGGSWADLAKTKRGRRLLTDGMRKLLAKNDLGSFPDVYGRMAWDKPAPTIKRECAHVGNGRYAHPEEDRLCSLREMSILQGFPRDYLVNGAALSNLYRHIGDAVPPLISYQLAHLCEWILTGTKPALEDVILTNTHLGISDIVKNESCSSLEAYHHDFESVGAATKAA